MTKPNATWMAWCCNHPKYLHDIESTACVVTDCDCAEYSVETLRETP